MKQKENRLALASLHVAVLLFGLSGVIGRFVGVPAHDIAWGRSLCSSLLLLLLLKLLREPLKLDSRRDYVLALCGGAVLAFHWTAFFLSIKAASVAVGTVTFSSFPLFTVLLEPVIFREKPQPRQLLLAAVMAVGVVITVPELSFRSEAARGALWGVASAASYAVLALINRSLSARYSSVKICMYQQGTAALVLTPFVLATGAVWTRTDVLGVAVIGVVCTAAAFSLFVRAQRYVRAGVAAVVSGMETVYGIVFAALFLGEYPDPGAILGAALIITAAALSSLKTR